MRSLLLIVEREVRERVQAKSFRLFSAGLFIMVLGVIIAMDRGPQIFGDDSYSLGVADGTPQEITDALTRFAELEDIEVEFVPYETEPQAQALLEEGEVDALFMDGTLTYDDSEISTLTTLTSNALYSYQIAQRLDALDIPEDQRQDLLSPDAVEVVVQDPGETNQGERQFIGFLAALALYITLAVYGNWILTGIVEEKSSRVVEVLLGLVRPHEMLAGKTLGILVVAIGQLALALLGAAVGLLLVGGSELPPVALDVVLAGVPLYILGLLIYSMLYASAGATVSRQADAQAAATPIVMVLLVPYMFAAIFVPQNPDGIAATIFSIFPLTSPLVMPSRVATGSPSAPELIACYALLVPTILLLAFIGGRIYAGAILSGRRFSLSTLLAMVVRPGEAK